MLNICFEKSRSNVAVLLLLLLAPVLCWGCYTGIEPCTPETRSEFCLRLKKNCGQLQAVNRCGETQTEDCGKCYGPLICGGQGVPNVCGMCELPTVKRDCTGGWCKIPSGCYTMGSKSPCGDLTSNGFGKETSHQVAISRPFVISEAEVTQNDFWLFMMYKPSQNRYMPKGTATDYHPVEYVSWHEAASFANVMSAKSSLESCYQCKGSGSFITCATAKLWASNITLCPGYRLPTEAEWEYAYRAGSLDDFYAVGSADGKIDQCNTTSKKLDAIGWYHLNAGDGKDTEKSWHHEIMKKKPNKWGLYDMAGNVWEWVHDWYQLDLTTAKNTDPWGPTTGTNRVLRGGGYERSSPKYFRASVRRHDIPDHLCFSVGFRLARTLLK